MIVAALVVGILGISQTMLGQALLGILVAAFGWLINRKSKQIHVMVNGRLENALKRIDLLETEHGIPKGAIVIPLQPEMNIPPIHPPSEEGSTNG